MNRTVIWVIAILIVLGLTASVMFFMKPESKVYAEDDSAAVIKIEKGDTFTIELKENPSTGYSWHCIADPKTAISLDSDQFIVTGAGDIVGAPGKHEFTFKTMETGNVKLKFEYYRPWDPENVEETYLFNFTVR